MSKAHETEQQAGDSTSAPEGRSVDLTFGLPPQLQYQLKILGPDDADALADMLRAHPSLSARILSAASHQLGLSVVSRARAIVASKPQSEAPVAETDKAPKPPEQAWVVAARRYNEAHADLVAKFNVATHFECAQDDQALNQADPVAVAAWQTKFGLNSDGKVGPATTAAATKGPGTVHAGGDHGLTQAQMDSAHRYNEAHAAESAKLRAAWNVADLNPASIADFQKLKGLAIDGRVGPDTIAMAEKEVKQTPSIAMLE